MAPLRHFKTMQHFGRCWAEALVLPGHVREWPQQMVRVTLPHELNQFDVHSGPLLEVPLLLKLENLRQEMPNKYPSTLYTTPCLKASNIIEERARHDNIAYRTDPIAGAAAAIVAWLGIGYLAYMRGHITPGLIHVGAVEPELNDELWLLTHPNTSSQDEYTRS
jgi:DNA-binding transcriptional LysR family regulator